MVYRKKKKNQKKNLSFVLNCCLDIALGVSYLWSHENNKQARPIYLCYTIHGFYTPLPFIQIFFSFVPTVKLCNTLYMLKLDIDSRKDNITEDKFTED